MNTRLTAAGLCALAIALGGCSAVRVEPVAVIPTALVEPVPATIAIHYPAEFRDYVHKEKRYGTDYEVNLGPVHVSELGRLLRAMFTSVVEVDDPQRVSQLQPPVRLVLEPHFEDYSFLTPRDMAGDIYAVTIRYRLNVYEPGGERVDGYVFTGFGRVQAGALSGTAPLLAATQRAMREAGAKLAVELPDEETIRVLLAGGPVVRQRGTSAAPREVLGSFGGGLPSPVPSLPEAPASAAQAEAVQDVPPADAPAAEPAAEPVQDVVPPESASPTGDERPETAPPPP